MGLVIGMTRRGAPLQTVQTHGRWKSPVTPTRYTWNEEALEALDWLVYGTVSPRLLSLLDSVHGALGASLSVNSSIYMHESNDKAS